jgi:ABC-type multidrug transport system ATPase subunit
MLTSLLPPTSGTAIVAGRSVTDDPAGVRKRIGYVGQGNGAGHYYRVIDELLMLGRFYGMGKQDSRQRAKELLDGLDLRDLAKRTVMTLSGGQRRRLDIAMGLMHRPRLMFLDEPSTGMDPQNRANLWEHILRMRAGHGTTIVLTTHYLEEADTMAERIVVIDNGLVIADDTAANLKATLAGDRITVTVATAEVEKAKHLLAGNGTEVAVDGTSISAGRSWAHVRHHDDRLEPADRDEHRSYERVLATPLTRSSLMAGRALKESAPPAVQAVILILVSIPFGFDLYPMHVLAGLVLLGVFGIGVGALSYALALMTRKNEWMFWIVQQSLLFPLLILSGIMLPLDQAVLTCAAGLFVGIRTIHRDTA